MHQAAALPQGSPQECNPVQRTAAGATQARRAGLAPEGTHTVHTLVTTDTRISLFQFMFQYIAFCHVRFVLFFFKPRREKKKQKQRMYRKKKILYFVGRGTRKAPPETT